MEYNIVLIEKPLDAGITMDEIVQMYKLLSGIEAIPIEIQGEHSAAMGFINLTDAEYMDYDYTSLFELIEGVLDDIENESQSHTYEVPNKYGVSTIHLTR